MSQVFYWRPRCDGYSSVTVGIRLPQNVPCVLLQWLCWLFLKWPGAAPLLNWGWTSLVPSVPLWGGTVQRASQVPARWPPTEWHSPTSTGFFQQHRNTTTLCSSGWGCYKQKQKHKHNHKHTPRSPESRLIKPAIFNRRNPTSSALVHNTIRGVQTQTQKHKRLRTSFQCSESSGSSKHRSTKTSTR